MGTTTAGSPSARLTPRKRHHLARTPGRLAAPRNVGLGDPCAGNRVERKEAKHHSAKWRRPSARPAPRARARPDYLRQTRAARDRRAVLGARSAPGPAPGLGRPALSTLQSRPDNLGWFQALPTAARKGRAFALLPPRPDSKDGWTLFRSHAPPKPKQM